jgi:hypothetical protein
LVGQLGLVYNRSQMDGHTSSVDDMRLRPFIHFSSDLAACIEILLHHASLYSAGAMVLGAYPATQRLCQKLMVLPSPKCTSVHAQNSAASVGDDEGGRVCHGLLVSVQRRRRTLLNRSRSKTLRPASRFGFVTFSNAQGSGRSLRCLLCVSCEGARTGVAVTCAVPPNV